MTAPRVMRYNIRYGGVGKARELAEVITAVDPDVVLLQEATHPDIVAQVADAARYPHFGSRRAYSTGFLSRLPVKSHQWHQPRGARHAFLELELDELRLFGLHLSAWFSKWSERRRHFEIRALLEGIRQHQEGFHLLLGDFNALAPGERLVVEKFPRWIRAMVWVSGRDIARDTIQTMIDARYADLWRRLNPNPDDPGYTFPTWDPHVRLDYAFVPVGYADRVTSFEIVKAPEVVKTASDHHPIVVTLA